MVNLSRRDHSDPDERKVILFEFIAASSLFLMVALILYMVFTYRPA